MSAHVGWVARRPGPYAQGPTGMGIAGLRDPSLASARAAGLFRRRQAQVLHELSRVINAGQVPKFSAEGGSHRPLHATEGLARCHDGIEPPGWDLCVECLCQPREPFGVFGHRPHIFWKDDWLRCGGTHDRAEPAQVRGAPGGPAGLPDIMAEQTGFEAQLGRLQIVQRIFTRTAQVTHGFIFDCGDIDRGEST